MKKTFRETLINRHFSAPRWGGRRLLSIGVSALLSVSTFLMVIPQTDTIVYGEPTEDLLLEEIPENDTEMIGMDFADEDVSYETKMSETDDEVYEEGSYDPITAYATGTGKNLQLGSSALSDNPAKPGAATVYYGKKDLKWRVINYDGNGALLNGAANNLTLLAGSTIGNNTIFNNTAPDTDCNNYDGSMLENAIDDIYSMTYFSDIEMAAIVRRELHVEEYKSGASSDGLSGRPLLNDDAPYIWPLSAKEAYTITKTNGVQDSSDNYMSLGSTTWWLRSPGGSIIYAAMVSRYGDVWGTGEHVGEAGGVRPAFNLNLSSIIFTSAAEGGKTATPGALSAPAAYDGAKGWKFTLRDNSIGAQTAGTIRRSGNTVNVPYKTTGTGIDRLSVLVTNKAYGESDAEIKYYGALKTSGAISASGTGEFSLPDNFDPAWKVYLVAEKICGDKKTDYAGEPSFLNIPAVNPVSIKDAKVVLKSAKLGYNGKNQTPVVKTIKGLNLNEGTDYSVSVQNSKGKSTNNYKAPGKYTLVIKGKGNYTGSTKVGYEIVKGTNPLNVTAVKEKYSVPFSKIKKKDQTINKNKLFKFRKKGAGSITYSVSSAKKDKKSFKKFFSVSSKGKLTIKKGLKKGSYTVKVNVKVKGDKNYKSATKTVKFTVEVK